MTSLTSLTENQGDVSNATLQVVREAKKLAGAKVMAGITNNEGGCHSKPKGEDNAK